MMIPYIILTIENDDDREFMADLYRTYHRLLYKEIYEIVQDSWNTEDLMQSLLEKLIDHIDQLRSFDTRQLIDYICAAAHNTAYNYNRAKKKNYFIDIDPDNEPSPSSLEDSIIHREDLASLALVWNHLDEKMQYLLSARYILKKSGKEMAAELGIPADNVRMAVVRAKRKAKRAMEEYTETENH